jgi:hypothetical protein
MWPRNDALTHHCEALRAVALKVKYALKQSNLHRFDVEIASAT